MYREDTIRSFLHFNTFYQRETKLVAINSAIYQRFVVILQNNYQTIFQLIKNTDYLPMARIMAIDFGRVRTGIAVTDPLQIIAGGLDTIETPKLEAFLTDYFSREEVETIVVGFPKTLQNEPAEVTRQITPFVNRLKKLFPEKRIVLFDERYTSKIAFQTMIDSGIGKKARQNKALIDKISATIILQNYMESNR